MPEGRQFAVTWSIPDDFGGMTEALLHRSRSFERVAGTPVTVLTFDDRPDTSDLADRLRQRGQLSERAQLLNLYDWLREHPLPGGSLSSTRDAFTPMNDADATEVHHRGDSVVARVRRDLEGRVLQVDHLRTDGTLALSDRRDTRQLGVLGGRSVVLCDECGRPVRSWQRIWGLYSAWLDALTAGNRCFMIIDSKTIARFMVTYRRAHVITAHVVHASHRPSVGDAGPVRESRRTVFERLSDFDLVALLSQRQAAEVADLFDSPRNLTVIPNLHALTTTSSPTERVPSHGIVLAALTERKRVSHAVDAVQLANTRLTVPLRLDVYGDGDRRAEIEESIADPAAIRIHGFASDARDRLTSASFLLLTSRSEGFPLVLVESLAAGCIPIVYDIRYGPADIIRHGRNGLLVPAGDIEALADAIEQLQEMSPRRLAAMRRHARASTKAFSEKRVVARWARELRQAAERKRRPRTIKTRIRDAAGRIPYASALHNIASRRSRPRPSRRSA